MNKQALQMKYHPAKKEVEFHRFQNGLEVPLKADSKLRQYMNKRGLLFFRTTVTSSLMIS